MPSLGNSKHSRDLLSKHDMMLKRVNLEMLLKQSLKESIEQDLEISSNKICF
jgi:hypothetical protein